MFAFIKIGILGAASINYHILSTESRQYFRNAIAMSGSVGNPWAFPLQNDHVKHSYEIAEKLGKPQQTDDDLVEFLKSIPAESLNQFSTIVVPDAVQFSIVFRPTIESKSSQVCISLPFIFILFNIWKKKIIFE